MKTWKTWIAGTASLSLAATLAACGSDGSSSAPSAQPKDGGKDAGAGAKQVEITFANWISVEEGTKEAFNQLIADFEKKHPNIKVKSIGIPFAQFKDQVLVSSTGGNSPDVTMSNQNFTPAFFGAKIAEPMESHLGAELINDIVDGSKAGVTFDGKVVAMPWAPHPNALFWNKALFKKAGLDPEKPPKTWDEMIEMAKKIAALGKDDKGNPIYGIGENGASDSYTGNMLMRIAYSYGGKFVDDKGAIVYDQGSALKESLMYVKDMITNKVSPKGAMMKDLRPMFANGALGMLIDGDFGRTNFRTMSGKGEAYDKEWGVATVPVGKSGKSETVFTEHQLVIPAGSKNKAEAAEFVKYLVSKDAMLIYHKLNGIMSSRKSIASLPEMNEDDYAKVFNAQMKSASPLPAANPKFDNAMKTSTDMIVLVTEGGKSAEEAISTVMPKIKELYK
ncbi:multiple sugar transport system substrate-binding protein [Paenibacillus sp. UNCCL117]|uniref:ABC transporter substrate-binding protein n=1 Tax=unclassified Paenibacillus TaxID=185978 RepID=UPI0008832D3E|nr:MULTISPECIES: ABC transporter substrate-binding protein [unclassified Paenibacillus]SDE07412.1 multiple sugar transport system substrate-binding protein [Paenibacillus sp. cl123]SFW59174.1 multiple sugar transport system substrate-binding protein [Paenibacillus sp. UNCCL117]